MSSNTTADAFGVDPVPASLLAPDLWVITDCYETRAAVHLTLRSRDDEHVVPFNRGLDGGWERLCALLDTPVDNPLAVRGAVVHATPDADTALHETDVVPRDSARHDGEHYTDRDPVEITDATFHENHALIHGRPYWEEGFREYHLDWDQWEHLCEIYNLPPGEPDQLVGTIVPRRTLNTSGWLDTLSEQRMIYSARAAIFAILAVYTLLLFHGLELFLIGLSIGLAAVGIILLVIHSWMVVGAYHQRFRTASDEPVSSPSEPLPPLADLRERYANGDISLDEYEHSVERTLAVDPSPPAPSTDASDTERTQ
jgi:uncharacterized membrane protein